MSDLIPFMMAVALQLTGYAPPDNMPIIQYHEPAHFHNVLCGGRACQLEMYTNNQVIHISSAVDFNSLQDQALLLHEIVHTLQHHNHGQATDCQTFIRNEREAYMAQAAWLARRGGGLMRVNQALKPHTCEAWKGDH